MIKPLSSMKVIAFLALATVATAAQDSVLIRRQLTPGSRETYKIEQVVKQNVEVPSMGEQDMIITTVASVEMLTGAVDQVKGTANVQTTTKWEKMTTDGSLAGMMGGQATPKIPEPKIEKATLDARNRLTFKIDPTAKAPTAGPGGMMGMPNMGAIGAMALLTFIELPEQPIKIGDELDFALPNAAGAATMGAKDNKMKVKFVGEKEIEGGKAWVVNFSGEMKLDMDTSKLPKKPGQQDNPMSDMAMTGTVQMTGEGLIDKKTGKTLSNMMTLKNDVRVILRGMGMEIPTKGVITLKMELAK